MRNKAIVAVTGALTCSVLLAGCNGDPGGRRQAAPVASPSVRVSTSSTTSSPTTSSPTTAPTPTASPTVDSRLAQALFSVAEKSRALKDDETATASRAVADGLSAARQGLAATRTAAYKTTPRDCGAVQARANRTQAGAASAARGVVAMGGVAAARAKKLGALRAAITALQQALATSGGRAASPSKADVDAALKSAQAQLATESTSLTTTKATAAGDLARARTMAATALDVYGRTC